VGRARGGMQGRKCEAWGQFKSGREVRLAWLLDVGAYEGA